MDDKLFVFNGNLQVDTEEKHLNAFVNMIYADIKQMKVYYEV